MERYVSLTGFRKIDQRKKADQTIPLLELLVMQVRARGDSVALANIGYPQEGKVIEVTNLELLMKLGVSLTGLPKSVRRSWRPSRRRGSGTGGARRNGRGNSRRSGRRRSRTRRKRLMRRMELGAESSTQTESVKLDVYEMLSLFEGSLWLGGCEATISWSPPFVGPLGMEAESIGFYQPRYSQGRWWNRVEDAGSLLEVSASQLCATSFPSCPFLPESQTGIVCCIVMVFAYGYGFSCITWIFLTVGRTLF